MDHLHFGAPQLIWLALTGACLGIALVPNGQPRDGNHSFLLALVSAAIGFALLYWGGFFS